MIVLKLWNDAHRRTPVDVFVYEPFDFAREFAAAKWLPVAGEVRAPIVSISALVAMKQAAGRDKDLQDIQALRKIEPYR
jgi:hypothetical protein